MLRFVAGAIATVGSFLMGGTNAEPQLYVQRTQPRNVNAQPHGQHYCTDLNTGIYRSNVEFLCLKHNAMDTCLDYAKQLIKYMRCMELPISHPSSSALLIVALRRFVDDPDVRCHYQEAFEHASIALAAIYAQTNELYNVKPTLRAANQSHLYNKVISPFFDIQEQLDLAKASYKSAPSRLMTSKKDMRTEAKCGDPKASLLRAADLWRKGKYNEAEKHIKHAVDRVPHYEGYVELLKDKRYSYEQFKDNFFADERRTDTPAFLTLSLRL